MSSAAGGRAIRGLGQLLLAQQHHAAAAGSAQAASSIALRLLGTASTSSSLPWRQEPGSSGSSGSNSRGAVLGALGLSAAAAGALAAQRHTAHADVETVSPTVSANPYKWPEDAKGVLPKTITLWQYEVCPFCCKVKAALDYYKLPYTVIEVNPLTKGELKWSTYKKVPVVRLDDDVVADSSQIMSRLAAEVAAARRWEEQQQQQAAATTARTSWGSKKQPAASASPSTPAGCSPEEEERWRRWVDERMVKVMTANIYRSWDETWESFRYITKHTNWSWGTREVARMSGAVLMWQIGKRMPAKYKIEGDLRANLYACCDEFMDAVGPSRPFLGGAVVNLADLSVYGILKAIEHTPTFNDCMDHHSRIAAWYKRVEEAIGPSARLP